MDFLEQCKAIKNELLSLSNKYDELTKKAEEILNCESRSKAQLQESCEHKISENDEKIAIVKAFIGIAKSRTDTLVSPTNIEKYDRTILSKLSLRANNETYNNAYASELYTKASSQLIYLENNSKSIKKDYENELWKLKNKTKTRLSTIQDEKEGVKKAQINYLQSSRVKMLVYNINNYCNLFSSKCETLNNFVEDIKIGWYELSLNLIPDNKTVANSVFGDLYIFDSDVLKVPFQIKVTTGKVLIIEYDNDSETMVFPLFQNILLGISRYYLDKFDQLVFIDPIRYNNTPLGVFSKMAEGEKSFIDRVPTSKEGIRKKLKSVISRIVIEENRSAFNIEVTKHKLLVFHNFPRGYDSESISQIKQLCVNASHYGFTVVLTTNNSQKRTYSDDDLEYIKTFSNYICYSQKKFSTTVDDKKTFVDFGELLNELPKDLVKIVEKNKKRTITGNFYKDWVGFSYALPSKGKRYIEKIPFGVNKDGDLMCLDFENDSFASFVCGASRSGKSNFLHTILTGIIKNYHPDDVEIWLIDFKMLEFSRYIEKLPPHIRYIILDESPELVYDIIDRLTEILKKREIKFKGKWDKLTDVPNDVYMPAIFVVIDEFSIMSQIIAESINTIGDNYALKLQILLSLGAGLGMHFIFSSQSFNEGSRGLTPFAKMQIQQRIALKTNFNEIKDTMDLKTISDTDRAMMEQLPRYHTLTKIPVNDYGNHLVLSKVLYMSKGSGSEQSVMIDEINDSIKPGKPFSPTNNKLYINKKPLIIDGNTYKLYTEFEPLFKKVLDESYGEFDGLVFIGEPRRMIQVYPIEIYDTYCENFIIISPVSEKMTCSSILLSFIKSLESQQYTYEILATRRNHLYKQLRFGCNLCVSEKTELTDVCRTIYEIKEKIENKEYGKKIYFLLGFESLINEMSYNDESPIKQGASSTKSKSNKFTNVVFEKREEGEMDIISQLGGFSGDVPASVNKTFDESYIEDEVSEELVAEYDARKDLKFILTQGPRFGYHFVMVFNSTTEAEQTKTDYSLFKHKILFRMARPDASTIVGSSNSSIVPEMGDHVYRYFNGTEAVSFRPLLHPGLSLDGLEMSLDGSINGSDEEEYLM